MDTRTFQNLKPFQTRRSQLSKLAPQSAFIIFSGNESHLSRFRANSHFVYLTAFEEPEACLVIRPSMNPSYTLFVRDKDPAIEVWDGYRYGPEEAKKIFQADQSFSIQKLKEKLPELLMGIDEIYYALGEDSERDKLILEARTKAQNLDRRSGRPKAWIRDPNEVLGEMRVIKDEFEVALMKEACALSAQAHNYVKQQVKPGMNEVQVQAHLFYSFYQQKASREGYSSIIASGANATVLHYRANNRDMLDGDLLLIDAGAEKSYYTADITRTFPVNGKFNSPQQAVYDAVLDVQKKLIDMVKPGFSLPELQEKAIILLTEKMVDLKLLSGKVSELVDSKKYHKYYPHGIGHYLGMDVHDVGRSKIDGKPRAFVENMVITVEPGIYIPTDDMDVPKEFRGIGVRIEDDILIQSSKPLNMTELAEK